MVDPVLVDIQKIAYDHCILELNDQLDDEFDFDLSSLRDFCIPTEDTRENVEHSDIPRLIRQYQRFMQLAIERPDGVNLASFNADQRSVYDVVIEASLGSDENCPANGKVFFVDGTGGTGKTFLFNALLLSIRRRGDIALAVASSGTASLLLAGGRTSHSMFKIPLEVDKTTVCKIKPNSDIATLLRMAKIVI
jgi:ATP-dependent DNA helicase PIF1